MAANKCIKACRRGQDVQLLFRPNVRMGKKCDLSNFDRGIIAGARQGGSSISETAKFLGFSRTTVFGVYSECCKKQRTFSELQFCGWKCIVNETGQKNTQRIKPLSG